MLTTRMRRAMQRMNYLVRAMCSPRSMEACFLFWGAHGSRVYIISATYHIYIYIIILPFQKIN